MTLSEGTVADHVAARDLVVALLALICCSRREGAFAADGSRNRVGVLDRGRRVRLVVNLAAASICGLESGGGRRGARSPEAAQGGDCEDPGQRRFHGSCAER